jgi:biotin carboxyl carrier protein
MSDLKNFILDDRVYETKLTLKFARRKPYAPPDPRKVLAYIPGVIRTIYVSEGQRLARGERLLVLEAMKMQNDLVAHDAGTVVRIHVKTGQMVAKGQVLLELEGLGDGPAAT